RPLLRWPPRLRRRSMGDSCTARQVEDGTHGPGRLLRVSTGPASPLLPLLQSIARRWPPAGTFQHQGSLDPTTSQIPACRLRRGRYRETHRPPQLRHTYASEMLRSGVEFLSIMKLLGHASPEMTMLYIDIALTDLQREFHAARSEPPPSRPSAENTGRLCPRRPGRSSGLLADHSTPARDVPAILARRRPAPLS